MPKKNKTTENTAKKVIHVKCTFIGSKKAGKTSLLKVQDDLTFNDKEESTIGAGYKHIDLEFEEAKLRLEVWDTSSNDRFNSLLDMYCRGAHVFFIVIDGADKNALANISTLKNKISSHCHENTSVFLIVNKWDEVSAVAGNVSLNAFSKDEIIAKAVENGIQAEDIYYTSAKEKTTVDNMFSDIFKKLYESRNKLLKKPNQSVLIEDERSEDLDDDLDVTYVPVYTRRPFFSRMSYESKIDHLQTVDAMADFDIVVKLLESYLAGHFIGIDWRHFKPEIEAILVLVEAGFFKGKTEDLVNQLKFLQQSEKYNEHGDFAKMMGAIETYGLSRVKQVETNTSSHFALKYPIKLFRSLTTHYASPQSTIESKYDQIYWSCISNYMTSFQTLHHLLKAYVGSHLNVARTHSGSVSALMALYAPHPDDHTKGVLNQTVMDFYSAIQMLENLEGYNQNEGDLAAVLKVIKAHLNDLTGAVSFQDDGTMNYRSNKS